MGKRTVIAVIAVFIIFTCSMSALSHEGTAFFGAGGGSKVDLPLVGEVDASAMSLPALTVILAGMDSFNPCAFFVLLFLLSLLIHSGSRARMLLIGGCFILMSGVVYFLFMSAWLNFFLILGTRAFITVAAGAVAVLVSLINIKDFFFFKKGVSLTISDEAKSKLLDRMRGLLKSTSVISALAATTVLAAAANSYELLCTAGFPMVYTRALTLKRLSTLQYYTYIGFYNVIYVIPLMAIMAIFVFTLGSRKLTEWQGRELKLLSGLMMLGLGLALLVRPTILTDAVSSLMLMLSAIVGTVAIIALSKKIGSRAHGEKIS